MVRLTYDMDQNRHYTEYSPTPYNNERTIVESYVIYAQSGTHKPQ